MKNRLNEILTLLVVVQYFNNHQKSLKVLEIIIQEKNYFSNPQSFSFEQKLLKILGATKKKKLNVLI